MTDSAPPAGVLRTAEDRFDVARERFPWEPSYATVGDGLRMAYVDVGPSDATETALLLHGEPTWGYLYRTMIPVLADAGFRVVVPDLIGFGRSDKPTDPETYTYSAHVGWVCELLDGLDLRDVTLFGQDWGGLIGTRVLAERPDRFARAVMSNTALPSSGPAFPGLEAQQRLPPELFLAMTGIDWRATVTDDDRIDPDLVHGALGASPIPYFVSWRIYAQEVAELRPSKVIPGWCLTTLDPEDLAAYDAPFPTVESTAGVRRFPLLVPLTADDPERLVCDRAWEVLEHWDRPFLTIWGDHCPHTHHEGGAAFRTRIPGASLPGVEHRVYRASHFIQEDLGPDVAEDIVAFVRRTPLDTIR